MCGNRDRQSNRPDGKSVPASTIKRLFPPPLNITRIDLIWCSMKLNFQCIQVWVNSFSVTIESYDRKSIRKWTKCAIRMCTHHFFSFVCLTSADNSIISLFAIIIKYDRHKNWAKIIYEQRFTISNGLAHNIISLGVEGLMVFSKGGKHIIREVDQNR